MITTPYSLPGSPMPVGRCVPCPAPPPCSPCPSPPPPDGGVRLRLPSAPLLAPMDTLRRHSWLPSAPLLAPMDTLRRHSWLPSAPLLAPMDTLRRHSWQPGALQLGDAAWDQRSSLSLENLDVEEVERLLFGALGGRGGGEARGGRDPRRDPITSYAPRQVESLLSLTEEEAGSQTQVFTPLEEQVSHMQSISASAPSLCVSPPSTMPPHHHASGSSLRSVYGGSTQSVDAESDRGSVACGRDGRGDAETETETEGQAGGHGGHEGDKTGSPLGRTLSFLRKMAGNRKNKEKERMKEREKEAREREARYSNGHLFTSLTVSATTLCSACNKSITAKEALSCPTCNVTIHNRCRDTLPNCAKMKQKQQKLALVRNSSALQNVAMRSKTPMMKERPSSAIYPSDSLRQSLLGARRVRSGLSLAKSVSTNNIAGNLNDDSPLGLRRILSQSTDSLNFRNRAMSMESLNDEGESFYTSMLEELERESKELEADSWSTAVDSSYLQTHRKDIIKRQDVIYELIQTELHHVRTLRIMEVFRRGMLDELGVEPGVVHAIFPCLDRLLDLHSRFCNTLVMRKNHSLAPGSSTNFTIHQLGDVLVEQFSGTNADEMRKSYSEFCSRHLKAVKLYKELLTRDKRFQQFIRRVSRGPLLRRHGVQECVLLVTQRITKYPVLIQRILDNTKGNEEEVDSMSQGLTLLRELLSSVDQQVQELELTQRLQEIRSRLDPRAETEVRGGGVFRGGELLRRRLVHEGTLLWKTANSRLKDVQVLLMTDILVFMQEKDQKFLFPCLDKPAVLSLQNLIVRDIANQERGMFLISDSTPPEMYELHAASKDNRNTWMKIIQQTVSCCPSREDFPLIETEDKALLRRLRADIQQKDREVLELLQERVTLFCDLAEVTSSQEVTVPNNSRNVFRADTPHAPQAEKILTDAMSEVDRLSELLLGSNVEAPHSSSSNGDQNHTGAPVSNGDTISVNGTHDVNSTQQKQDRNGNQLHNRISNEEVCQRLVNLSTQLHALQAAVIRQDSILELSSREGFAPGSTPTTPVPLPSGPPARLCRSMSRDTGMDASSPGSLSSSGSVSGGGGGDYALLQRQNSMLQEEVGRLRAAEARLKDSEKARTELEQKLRDSQGGGGGGGKGEGGGPGEGVVSGKQEGNDTVDTAPQQVTMAPLAPQEDQYEASDEEENSLETEDEEIHVRPRSASPRDLQDIPEDAEEEKAADSDQYQSDQYQSSSDILKAMEKTQKNGSGGRKYKLK